MPPHPRRPGSFGALPNQLGSPVPEGKLPSDSSKKILYLAQAQARFLARFIQEVMETIGRHRDSQPSSPLDENRDP